MLTEIHIHISGTNELQLHQSRKISACCAILHTSQILQRRNISINGRMFVAVVVVVFSIFSFLLYDLCVCFFFKIPLTISHTVYGSLELWLSIDFICTQNQSKHTLLLRAVLIADACYCYSTNHCFLFISTMVIRIYPNEWIYGDFTVLIDYQCSKIHSKKNQQPTTTSERDTNYCKK